MTILGIDLGGTKTAVVLGSADGAIHGRECFPTEPPLGPGNWVERVVAATARFGDGARADCISISAGGPIDVAQGMLKNPPNLPGWEAAIGSMLSDALGGLPWHLMHDAQAAVWAENQFRASKGGNDGAVINKMALLTFGTGIGLGVIWNGRLLELPGEIGHWRVAEEGPALYGKAGSLEGLASGAGLAALALASGSFPEKADARALAQLAREGDRSALALFDQVAVQLGRQCARLIDLFGFELIALGTLAIHAGDLLLDRIREVAVQEALPHLGKACRIEPSALGEQLGDVAALSAAIQAGYQEPFGHSVKSDQTSFVSGPSSRLQLKRLSEVCDRVHSSPAVLGAIERGCRMLCECLAAGGKVLSCGNGGSATDAAHLAEELVGRYRNNRRALPSISLSSDGPALTCISNDFGYDHVFARQVEALGKPGDLLVAFTTSGNSENINRALRSAKALGMRSICCTGKGGGEALLLADLAIHIPDQDSARIQELHTFVLHAFCEAAEHAFADG